VALNKTGPELIKKILFIILAFTVLVMPSDLFGQKQKPKNKSWYDDKLFHFGFSLGLNTMDFKITPSQTYLNVDSLYPEVSHLNKHPDSHRSSSRKSLGYKVPAGSLIRAEEHYLL
jgi:hypothetical protein